MNFSVRQIRALSVLKTTNTYLKQKHNSTVWTIWHPEHFSVRFKLTCKDVMKLVSYGYLVSGTENKFFLKTCKNIW